MILCAITIKITFARKISCIKFFYFLNSFLTSNCFPLFQLIVLLRLCSLVSKSVFVTKFPSANLKVKVPAAKLLNSGVLMYLS